ncbi:MAG: thiamine phosphate synthase [Gammaproteobacteria bacterium]
MTRACLPGGLYAITDSQLIPAAKLYEQVAAAIRGGAAVIQYRDKISDHEQRRQQASVLARLCDDHAVPLIINDDVELAAAVGASGVHLGKSDDTVRSARKVLGADAIIGVSCYNMLERAVEATGEGADYVAFGRFYASQSKPDTVTAKPELLLRARRCLHVPIVAIGGITPENGQPLITAGAHLLAAIHGVFGQADVQASARRYAELFSAPT